MAGNLKEVAEVVILDDEEDEVDNGNFINLDNEIVGNHEERGATPNQLLNMMKAQIKNQLQTGQKKPYEAPLGSGPNRTASGRSIWDLDWRRAFSSNSSNRSQISRPTAAGAGSSGGYAAIMLPDGMYVTPEMIPLYFNSKKPRSSAPATASAQGPSDSPKLIDFLAPRGGEPQCACWKKWHKQTGSSESLITQEMSGPFQRLFSADGYNAAAASSSATGKRSSKEVLDLELRLSCGKKPRN